MAGGRGLVAAHEYDGLSSASAGRQREQHRRDRVPFDFLVFCMLGPMIYIYIP